ncbi:MAG: hypothetical protein IPK19_05035 [Chloroflexi bacterium]|nr:hypothetical protein [Chloroflexota bacterium]
MDQKYTRRQVLGLLSVAAAGLAASCASLGGEPDFTVVITDRNRFLPAALVVPVGAQVAWKNQSVSLHTVTGDPVLARSQASARLPEGAEPWDSGDLYTGEIWRYTFAVPGSYVYFSRPYELDGMIGAIEVLG